MNIDIIDPPGGISTSRFETCIESVFKGEKKTAEYVNVIFVGQDDLRLMKKEYFELDVFTDVIAFNLNEPDESIEGELYLSFKQIKDNANLYKTAELDEVMRVLIHGCLHLCGYEDDTVIQKDQMTQLENKYIKQMKALRQ